MSLQFDVMLAIFVTTIQKFLLVGMARLLHRFRLLAVSLKF